MKQVFPRRRMLVGLAAIAVAIGTVAIWPKVGQMRGKVYKDGSYFAVSDADAHGYATALVTISNDRITRVVLNEITEKGVPKDYSKYPWPASKEAHEKLPAQFVAKNGTDVDVIAKATESTNKYKQAVARALEKARVSPTDKSKYFDGTFFGKSASGQHGYAVTRVTIKGDKITGVVLDWVSADGTMMDWAKEAKSFPTGVKARDEMAKRFVEKNSADVDVFTGATNSSQAYKEAVANALKAATIR